MSLSLLGSPVLAPAAQAAEPDDTESTRRIGVIALAGAISAVGQTPELATPLPFTTTSLADALELDRRLVAGLDEALVGTALATGLSKLDGVEVLESSGNRISFTYTRTVEDLPLPLVHDDGDLRLGSNAGAGELDVSLVTRESDPFVVEVDEGMEDPLLKVALVSQPVMELSVDISTPSLPGFGARQGFTEVRVSGGRYEIHRDQLITMRDPDGRGLLTLEDLRYSTLPDLFRVETDRDDVDVQLAVRLPDSLPGGTGDAREGTLTLADEDTPEDAVWPAAADARTAYGTSLARATGLSMADGLTGLAQYTGTVLALQDSADVAFPNLEGGTADLFAPGDRLLQLLSTAAAAQVTCGAAPENPPTGVAAPGDAVYCQAITPDGLGAATGVSWTTHGGNGTVASADRTRVGAVGPAPTEVVRVDGSDGEPDVSVTFTAGDHELTARSMPHTVQDVVRRIGELGESTASASLSADRLDVAVAIKQASSGTPLVIGNAGSLGALVGLTGLKSPGGSAAARATATATGSSFDVGFGIPTAAPTEGRIRPTYLLPSDASMLRIQDVSATPPTTVTGLDARIGFLGVKADLTRLELDASGGDAVELTLVREGAATNPLRVDELLKGEGALDPTMLDLDSRVTAAIGFTATEEAIPGGGYAAGTTAARSGDVAVEWGTAGLPKVAATNGYPELRVFDPVPASFLSGTARVTPGSGGAADQVHVDVTLPAGKASLYEVLNVTPPTGPADVEVTRRLIMDGLACQNVVLKDGDTLTCPELAPLGKTPLTAGPVELIVLGDPFALRDSVIEGFSATLSSFDRLTGDNVTESPAVADDQYVSSLPLVDLVPSQLAVEREALRQGLAAISAAATQDELGGASTPVSSAQELSAAVGSLVKLGNTSGYAPSLGYSLTTQQLGVTLTASAPAGTRLQAPLRLNDASRGQVTSAPVGPDAEPATLPVDVASSTTLAITVDRTTARPAVGGDTVTDSTATLLRSGTGLDGHQLLAGVTGLGVTGQGSSADLGVRVVTDYVQDGDGTGRLETRRSNKQGRTGKAAVADLVVGTDDTIHYEAAATDSSGGTGTPQPEPDPMQVKFLAEGLDGLSAALEGAMDGAAAANLGEGGAPVSAPLIGTDLDAGAGVPGILTDLTSQLRTALDTDDVRDAVTAASLADELEPAVVAAVNDTAGLEDVSASGVSVAVTCGDPGDPVACDDDSPTGWDTVSVTVGLTGSSRTGEVTFDTGLAGLEVRSDKKVATATSWTLPVTLRLQRDVGPQVVVGDGQALELDVAAAMPEGGLKAIVGYLPAQLTPVGAEGGRIDTTVRIAPEQGTYDLFDLYDGKLAATPEFTDDGAPAEQGLELDFATISTTPGALDLVGGITIPWSAAQGFDAGDVVYEDVGLNVGKVVSTMATPFKVADPYLAPVRGVIDVIRTPIPVISDLSELAGGGEVSLLSLLEKLADAKGSKQLQMAHRVIGLVDGVTKLVGAIGTFGSETVLLSDVEAAGEVLRIDPKEVEVYDKCTQSVSTSTTTTTPGGTPSTTTKKSAPAPCPDENMFAQGKTKKGAAGQTTADTRTGTRTVKKTVLTQKTKGVTASVPGFSLPFLEDSDQIMDVLTGQGEASYFRLDLGSLTAQVAYTQRFGPIMAGPVPIMPFVGGSISVEGRLAMGFDSRPQTLAVQSLSHPGAVDELLGKYTGFKDIITQGFYLDDLDADGVDVPEVKLVTTLEAGAGVSIGIVTAGLKGGLTLTINLDLNDPDDDGRLRTAEIETMFAGNAKCIFDASADLQAFISVFVEIELLLTTLEYDFDILRLGPYQLFKYGCKPSEPTLVFQDEGSNVLALTSGSRNDRRGMGGTVVADEYEVRQFDAGATTTYEVAAFDRVQRVSVTKVDAGYRTTIYRAGTTVSGADVQGTVTTTAAPVFVADGATGDDRLEFLQGETFVDGASGPELRQTPFSTRVTDLRGGEGADTLTTGAGQDLVVGDGGDDDIDAGAGDDVVRGGSDDDVIGGGSGRDDLAGDAGADRVEGGPGGDRADGGADNDSLVGGPGRDTRAMLVRPRGSVPGVVTEQVRLGFDSGDVLVGGDGGDSVDGGDGGDVVVGGPASSLTTAALADLFTDGSRTVNVLTQGAAEGDPNTIGTETVVVDTAAEPKDRDLDDLCESGPALTGAGTSDFVTGGAEGDVVVGGDAADQLDGGAGPDRMCGRHGEDLIAGDGAAEAPEGNSDTIRGGHGNDRIDGGPDTDVLYGDDVRLWRDGRLVRDGSLGEGADGGGDDFVDGGVGADVIAGGGGADLVIGGEDHDRAYGEGKDTAEPAVAAPSVAQRLLACNPTTRVVKGLVDLDGDLLAGESGAGVVADDGQLAGLEVDEGVVGAVGATGPFQGLVAGDVVVIGGRIDLDGDGAITTADTGVVDLPSRLGPTHANTEGDCVLAGDGDDELRGGLGSDYLGSGAGRDLALGGNGNDLLLGDDGVDVLRGGRHHDVLVGGLDDDHLVGEDGEDRLRGNEGADDLVGGSDQTGADDGQDVLLGGPERDVLAAENAAVVSEDIVTALATAPWIGAGVVPAGVTAGDDSDLTFDGSALACDDEAPRRWLTLLADDGVVGDAKESPGTEPAYDELYGGSDCDFVFGSVGDDLVRGGPDTDVVEAGPGSDLAYGDDGDDVVVGGSTVDPTEDTPVTVGRSGAGVPDGNDTLRGDGGPDGEDGSDVVAGDNALPVRVDSADFDGVHGPSYVLQLMDVATATGVAPAAGTAGADVVDGGGDVDRVFGQGGDDRLSGDTGEDYLEGNAGTDRLTGGDGDDDLVGGSSTDDALPLGGTGGRLQQVLSAAPYDASAAGLADAGDVLSGGAGDDIALGDNGRVTRPSDGVRDIALTDEADADLAAAAGDDEISGGDDDDRLFGGDADDVVDAGGGADHVEGNSGADGLTGGADGDAVIGGSSVSPSGDGTIGSLPSPAIPDGNDGIYGDEPGDDIVASDLLLGDNATVLVLDTGRWVVQLADVPLRAAAAVGTSGDDTVDGGGAADGEPGAADRVFGQGGDDTVTTGSAGDYVEGNSGSDLVRSGAGEDDVVGGTSAADGRPLGLNGTRLQGKVVPRLDTSAAGVLDEEDEVHGGLGDDTVLGDNGRITRPAPGPGVAVPDVAMADTGDAATYGSDELWGDEDHDVLYGQLDDGRSGEAGLGEGDVLEGGSGNDALLGDLAVVKRTPASELPGDRTLALRSDQVNEKVLQDGSVVAETWVPNGQARNGGPDLARGGSGNDVFHLGGGADVGNGETGNDTVFGGDGDDGLWGGTGHDRIFGGFGADDLDLKTRSGDPAVYDDLRADEDDDGVRSTRNGDDLVYGGWGPDELQADEGAAGRTATVTDQLIDWTGPHNVYYVCDGAYGPGRIVRESSPAMMDLLTSLASAGGARELRSEGSGGWYDLGLVTNADRSRNSARSPEHPGHFTCG